MVKKTKHEDNDFREEDEGDRKKIKKKNRWKQEGKKRKSINCEL